MALTAIEVYHVYAPGFNGGLSCKALARVTRDDGTLAADYSGPAEIWLDGVLDVTNMLFVSFGVGETVKDGYQLGFIQAPNGYSGSWPYQPWAWSYDITLTKSDDPLDTLNVTPSDAIMGAYSGTILEGSHSPEAPTGARVRITDVAVWPTDAQPDHWVWTDIFISGIPDPPATYTETTTVNYVEFVSQYPGSLASVDVAAWVGDPVVPGSLSFPSVSGSYSFTFLMTNWTAAESNLWVQFGCNPADAVEPVTFLWDFGDGNTSDAQNPNKMYEVPGTWTVGLTISDAAGYTVNALRGYLLPDLIEITTVTSAYIPLTCNGWADVVEGLSISFIGEAYDPMGTIAYLWDFGDGENSTEQNPTHVYAAAGEYSVTFTVLETDGEQRSANTQLFVNPAEPLIATFTWVVNGLDVEFTDTTGPEGTRHWLLGNGDESWQYDFATFTYTYPVSGTFTVELILDAGEGGVYTGSNVITVGTVGSSGWSIRVFGAAKEPV